MRLFIGIPLIDTIKKSIAGQLERTVKPTLNRIGTFRWVAPDCLHITLLFIGEVADGKVPAIQKRMGDLKLPESFHVELGSIDRFPQKRGPPRVLVISLKPGGGECTRLYQTVAAEFGEFASDRRYSPHITLARAKRSRRNNSGISPQRLTAQSDFEAAFDGIPSFSGNLDVTRIALFESALTPNGSRYTEIGSADLAFRDEL